MAFDTMGIQHCCVSHHPTVRLGRANPLQKILRFDHGMIFHVAARAGTAGVFGIGSIHNSNSIRSTIFSHPNSHSSSAVRITLDGGSPRAPQLIRSNLMTSREASQRENFLTMSEVAERCSLSERQIRRHIQQGHLRVVRIGRAVRIKPSDEERFINGVWE
jgi:excisionase family DNA binding protein